jgi:hypothetical protein
MRRLGCAAVLGLIIGLVALVPRRGHAPPSRPFPLNGRKDLWHVKGCRQECPGHPLGYNSREPAAAPAPPVASDGVPAAGSRPHLEGRHTDGSCAFCDWLDETPVPGYRRRGAL